EARRHRRDFDRVLAAVADVERVDLSLTAAAVLDGRNGIAERLGDVLRRVGDAAARGRRQSGRRECRAQKQSHVVLSPGWRVGIISQSRGPTLAASSWTGRFAES